MKKLLIILCYILAFYAILFPFAYFGKNMDKKEVRASHILVDTIDEAQKVKQELNEGKDFGELAKKYSIDEYSKNSNGDFGFNQRGSLYENVENTIFKLPKNHISEPVKTDLGWHIFKVTDIHYYSDEKNFRFSPLKYLDL